MVLPYESTSGPGYDLETFAYMRGGFPLLPDPAGFIPFHKQGAPLPDPYQVHVQSIQVKQAVDPGPFNPLPFTRWFGTNVKQINQPGFLSVNETITWR